MIGRYCEIKGIEEERNLKPGLNYRRPEYRREVFLRFYEFHLKYKAHAGAIYYAMPFIHKRFNYTDDDKLLLAYINGCCQNIITAKMIFDKIKEASCLEEVEAWFNLNYEKFGWDTDRRYFKTKLIDSLRYYFKLTEGGQRKFFDSIANTNDKYENFRKLWDFVINNFPYFGRLSTFSYMEYLKVSGLNIDCDQLFIEDIKGSKSHRNGLCKVLGRDDFDWHKTEVVYTQEMIDWLTKEAEVLLEEARARFDHEDISYFTLETTLCCYKSWFRVNRRYPNVYNDMYHDRIKYAESMWGENFEIYWEMRREILPPHLLLEMNPNDVGVNKLKQNHFRLTGEVIMMERDWSCFDNKYKKRLSC